MEWLYQNRPLDEIPENAYGFIYKITCSSNGKIYIGKKALLYAVKKRISKRVIKATKTRKRVEMSKKDSGWKTYWGSSKSLLADISSMGEGFFKKEIICFARNKSELAYLEVVHQILEKVLEIPSYNDWIGCKIFKKQLYE